MTGNIIWIATIVFLSIVCFLSIVSVRIHRNERRLRTVELRTQSMQLELDSHRQQYQMDQTDQGIFENKVRMVDFQEEIRQIRDYMNTEAVWVGGQASFEEKIETMNFKVPDQSILELVKTIVSYAQKEENDLLKVKLSVIEKIGYYEIEMEDNGTGLILEEIHSNAVDYQKICNIKNQLKMTVNGSFSMGSNPWTGTTIKIMIPKSN